MNTATANTRRQMMPRNELIMFEHCRLSINDLEESGDKGPVWVVNTSPKSERTELHLAIEQLNGKGKPTDVMIPVTFIPLNLTEWCPKRQLLESDQFRKALQRRYLTLVDADSAEKMLESDLARVEQERVNRALTEVIEASAALSVGAGAGDADPSELSPRIVSIIEGLDESDDTSVQVTLMNTGGLLAKELRAVLRAVSEKGADRFKGVIKFCEDELERLGETK